MGSLMDWYNQNGFGNLMGGAQQSILGAYGGLAQQQQAFQNLQGLQTYTTAGTSIYARGVPQGFLYPTPQNSPMEVKIKKTGKILLDLRREIEDWHGDILRAT